MFDVSVQWNTTTSESSNTQRQTRKWQTVDSQDWIASLLCREMGCILESTLSLKGKFSSCSLHGEVREGSSPLELADSLCLAQGLCSRHGGAWPLLLQLNCAPATSSLDSMCASVFHTNLLICVLQSVQRYELWAMSSLMSNVWLFQTHDRSPNTSLECLAHKSELWWHNLHLYYTYTVLHINVTRFSVFLSSTEAQLPA